jgi:hypothetical protein
MANNFAEALFGGRDAAIQSRIAQQQAQQAQQANAFQMEQAQLKASQSQEDRGQSQLVNMARGWKTVQPQNRQAYYERFIKPAIAQQFGDPGPYDENAVNGVAEQILAAYGGGKAQNPYEGLPSDIQSLRLLQSDPALAALDRERRQASGMVPKLVETAQGYGWGTPGAGIDLAPLGGVAGGGFGIKETDDYVRSILSKAQGLDPNAPPEQQAAALLPLLIQQESAGNPNAVSPKGAQGLTQVMPATGQDPGFGVRPLQDGTPGENVRFGRDYLTAMLRRYPGRPDLALAAYNAGPGVADRFSGPQASGPAPIAQPYRAPAAPPAGYRANPDGTMAAIPGGPADPNVIKPMTATQRAKLEQTQRKERQMVGTMESSFDQSIRLIDDILKNRGAFSGVTGLGRVGSAIPGTNWADIATKLDTLRARSAFGALQEMRANSPTGGALGAVSERELYLLQNAETQLQDSQSPESLEQSLRDYKATLMDSKRRMKEGVSEFYQQEGLQEQGTPSGDDLDSLLDLYP